MHDSIMNYIAEPEDTLRYTNELFSYIANGSLKIKVHKEHPFTAEGVRQSQIDIAGKGTSGKLIIKIAD